MTFYCGVTYTGHTFFIDFSANDCSTNNNFQFFTCIQLNTGCITQTDCALTGVRSWRRKWTTADAYSKFRELNDCVQLLELVCKYCRQKPFLVNAKISAGMDCIAGNDTSKGFAL